MLTLRLLVGFALVLVCGFMNQVCLFDMPAIGFVWFDCLLSLEFAWVVLICVFCWFWFAFGVVICLSICLCGYLLVCACTVNFGCVAMLCCYCVVCFGFACVIPIVCSCYLLCLLLFHSVSLIGLIWLPLPGCCGWLFCFGAWWVWGL